MGAIVTPLIVPIVTLAFGWRAAFLATGIMGLIWLPIWLLIYRRPRETGRLSAAELAWIEQDPPRDDPKVPWLSLLRHRQTWAYVGGKVMIDPIWGMFLS